MNRGAAFISSDAFGVGQLRNPPTWKNFHKRTGLWFGSATGSNSGFGFQQDGSFDSTHNGSRSDNLMAFMMSFNGGYPYEPSGLNATNWSNYTHAAVGKQVTLSPSNPTDTTGLLSQMLSLADAGSISVIVKGSFPGEAIRGWLYLGNGQWQSDSLSETATTSSLLNLAAAGATGTFTAVPTESGVRLGIDADGDGVLDADDAKPGVANFRVTNLALTGTASASSMWDSLHSPAQAIDGSTIGYFHQNALFHSGFSQNPSWQVDLGTNAQISLIQLFNRWDCCGDRLANVSVFVSEVPFASTDLTQTRSQSGVHEFLLSGQAGLLPQIPMQTPGRYVRVQINTPGNYLQLAEVRVFGYPIATFVNPGTQSTQSGATANLALTLTNPQKAAYTFSAVNLPPGLTINSATGVISGKVTATAPASYAVTVNAAGFGNPSVSFTWNVLKGAS